jgi:hypothetical protein
MAIQARDQSAYPIFGIGQNVTQALTPYRATIHGERIVIIAATQVIDSDLQEAWTATATQPRLASAYDVDALVAAVEAARKTADTVVVYLHWGTELSTGAPSWTAARTLCRNRWPSPRRRHPPKSNGSPTTAR